MLKGRRQEKERKARVEKEEQERIQREAAEAHQRELEEFDDMKELAEVALNNRKLAKDFKDTKEPLKDGLALLRALDQVEDGCVNWGRVNKTCKNIIQTLVLNCL